MTLPQNVEKSAFRAGQYVIYDSRGQIWYGAKRGTSGWIARPAPNNPARSVARTHVADTLTSLATKLAGLAEPRVIEPF